MEPPAKRPRLGISPYNNDDQDDADGDELNLEPEQVNTLRDPGYQLEKSRAHAANRLKSAWEQIFEKYEKDFTGIGDEIDLETGEVVVDNGHIQSLQYTEIGGQGGDDEDDDDDDESIDEEERLLQGKGSKERRLSAVGENQNSTLTSLVRPLGPPGQPQPWSGMQWGMAGPPRISSMFGPPNPFGSFSAPFSVPSGMDSLVDTAWKAPELPVVEKAIEPAWKAPDLPPPKPPGPRITTVKKKLLTARSVHSDGGREQDQDEDEDDLLMGSSTTPMTRPNGSVTVKKMKMLLPPSLAQGTPSSGRGNPPKRKSTPKAKADNSSKPKGSTGKRKVAQKTSNEDPLAKPISDSGSGPKDCTHMNENERPQSHPTPASNKQVVAVKSKKSNKILPTQRLEVAIEKPAADLYTNHTSPDNTLNTKPTNQKLRIEIVVAKKIDTALYRVVEDSGNSSQVPSVDQPPFNTSEETNHPSKDMRKRTRGRRSGAKKTFARNVIDSTYGFSDDEEPALPRPRTTKQRPPTSKERTEQDDSLNPPQPQEAIAQEVGTAKEVSPAPENPPGAIKEREKDALSHGDERRETTDQDIPGESVPDVNTRNAVDPSFDFSDEDEAALPKARIRGGGKLSREESKDVAQNDNPVPGVAGDEATLTTFEGHSPSSLDSNDWQHNIPDENLEEPPIFDANDGLAEQEVISGKVSIPQDSSESVDQGSGNDVALAVDPAAPPVPVESSNSPLTLEANPESNELPTEHDTTTQLESTLPTDGWEPTVTGPIDLAEAYPVRLLSMKPRRKRKISTAFTEESLASPAALEEEKPKQTFILAPVKRFKRLKPTPPIEVPDIGVGSQSEERTVQAQPEPELPAGNDFALQEANPISPAIQESPQLQAPATAPEEPETATVDLGFTDLTIPESPPLLQPEFRSSLLGIVDEQELSTLAELDDPDADAGAGSDADPSPENDMDTSIDLGLDFDSPESNHDHNPHSTPLPDLRSPELGEEDQGLNPETSPLPYSSPSKAVKAAKQAKKARRPAKLPQPQPSTPSKKSGSRPKKPQPRGNSKPQVASSKPAHPPSSALSARTKGILSLVSDNEGSDDDELSLTPGGHRPGPPRYYTPKHDKEADAEKLKHTSLTAPLMRMKLLSSSKKGIVNNPRTPSSRRRTLISTVAVNNNYNDENQKPRGGRGILPSSIASSRMYFSADRRPSTSTSASSSGAVVINSSGGGGLRNRGITKRRRSAVIGGSRLAAANPVVPEYVDDSVVETPGGTKRRCGEDGFHCDRDFCFVCL
ncbi:hypothetical protein V8F20_000416 [Naviculisporaceae sp. PSN 640]